MADKTPEQIAAEEAAAREAADKKAAAEKEAADKAEARRLAEEDKILVVMIKDGEKLKVHPSCVADHESLGWTKAK